MTASALVALGRQQKLGRNRPCLRILHWLPGSSKVKAKPCSLARKARPALCGAPKPSTLPAEPRAGNGGAAARAPGCLAAEPPGRANMAPGGLRFPSERSDDAVGARFPAAPPGLIGRCSTNPRASAWHRLPLFAAAGPGRRWGFNRPSAEPSPLLRCGVPGPRLPGRPSCPTHARASAAQSRWTLCLRASEAHSG